MFVEEKFRTTSKATLSVFSQFPPSIITVSCLTSEDAACGGKNPLKGNNSRLLVDPCCGENEI